MITEIEQIKDLKVRALAYKRRAEKPNGDPIFGFSFLFSPEGFIFWSDVMNEKTVTHHPCYPKDELTELEIYKGALELIKSGSYTTITNAIIKLLNPDIDLQVIAPLYCNELIGRVATKPEHISVLEKLISELEPKEGFKVGDTVYWGELKGEADILLPTGEDPLRVQFNNGKVKYFTKDGRDDVNLPPVLSYQPYTLQSFTQDRKDIEKPKVEIEKGTVVYYRDNNQDWFTGHYSHRNKSGRHECFSGQSLMGRTNSWDEISLTNPLIDKDYKLID